MNKLKTFITLALVAAFVWWCWPSQPYTTSPDKTEELKRLEAENDSLRQLSLQLEKERQCLLIRADSLEQLVEIDQEIIHQLKIQTHEKIHAIAGYDGDELYRFFTDYPAPATAADSTAH